MIRAFILMAITLVVIVEAGIGKTYHYRWNNNFASPENWQANALPEDFSHISFPESFNGEGAHYKVDTDLHISRFEFPSVGNMEFEDGTNFEFAEMEWITTTTTTAPPTTTTTTTGNTTATTTTTSNTTTTTTMYEPYQLPAPKAVWKSKSDDQMDFECADNWLDEDDKAVSLPPCVDDTITFNTTSNAYQIRLPPNQFATEVIFNGKAYDVFTQDELKAAMNPFEFSGDAINLNDRDCDSQFITIEEPCLAYCRNSCPHKEIVNNKLGLAQRRLRDAKIEKKNVDNVAAVFDNAEQEQSEIDANNVFTGIVDGPTKRYAEPKGTTSICDPGVCDGYFEESTTGRPQVSSSNGNVSIVVESFTHFFTKCGPATSPFRRDTIPDECVAQWNTKRRRAATMTPEEAFQTYFEGYFNSVTNSSEISIGDFNRFLTYQTQLQGSNWLEEHMSAKIEAMWSTELVKYLPSNRYPKEISGEAGVVYDPKIGEFTVVWDAEIKANSHLKHYYTGVTLGNIMKTALKCIVSRAFEGSAELKTLAPTLFAHWCNASTQKALYEEYQTYGAPKAEVAIMKVPVKQITLLVPKEEAPETWVEDTHFYLDMFKAKVIQAQHAAMVSKVTSEFKNYWIGDLTRLKFGKGIEVIPGHTSDTDRATVDVKMDVIMPYAVMWYSPEATKQSSVFSKRVDVEVSKALVVMTKAEVGNLVTLAARGVQDAMPTTASPDEAGGDKESSSSIVPIAAAAGGGFLVILIIIFVVVRRKNQDNALGGGKEKKKKVKKVKAQTATRSVVAFENPMYDDASKGDVMAYEDGLDGGDEGLYDEPALTTAYQPSGKVSEKSNPMYQSAENLVNNDDQYLDVAPDTDDDE